MASFRGFVALLLLPFIAAEQLKIRVDDDVAVYQDGKAVINSHDIAGWQWKSVYDVELTADVLVLTAYNQGGPGGILLTIDGETVPLDKWKCNKLNTRGQNPEEVYPGSLGNNFDDSAWGNAVSVNNAWGNTAGFTNNNAWFWADPASEKMVVCRMRLRASTTLSESKCVYPEAKERALKIRVDDDVAVYQGNSAVINSHAIAGWQWREVYDAKLTTNLLVLTAWNQGGPGGILLTIDGQTTSPNQWKCNKLSNQGQNPEEVYPGVLGLDFDDSSWGDAVSVNNAWGNTAGFTNNNAWFWGGPASDKMVICRMKLAECHVPVKPQRQCVYPAAKQRSMKIRVDDDVAVYQGTSTLVNSHDIAGWQWKSVYDVSLNTNLVVLTAYNQGGPGGILVTIDGQTAALNQWKCNKLNDRAQNPEEVYPGVLGLDFDDSAWKSAISVNNAWGNTAGFTNNNAWFWADPASEKMVVCRMKLAECEVPVVVDPVKPATPVVDPVEPPAPVVDPVEPPAPVVDPVEPPAPVVDPVEPPAPVVDPVEPPAPVVDPTEAPTCVKQRAMWAENGIPVDEPAFTDDCQFELKQCNADKCFCVTPKKGKRAYSPVEVPLDVAYDCSRKPRKCQKKRFGLIMKNKSGFIPVCAKSGHYEKKQCYEGECWCVKPKGGKERKNTRTSGDLKC